jgi:adenylate cyclase
MAAFGTVNAREARVCIQLIDLAGFARATRDAEPERVMAFLEVFFVELGTRIRAHGGRLVKILGDGGLAVFAHDRARDAVGCAVAVSARVDELARRSALALRMGANLHVATVIEGEFGPEDDRRYDIIGPGVMHTFRMGAGPGIRISEPVYRQLASSERTGWSKHRPPATYEWEGAR